MERRPAAGRSRIVALAAAGLIAALLAGASAEETPSFELLEPASGRTVVVAPGAPLLHLVFFATWCTPCLEELERLEALEARWNERGYRLVLIAVPTRHDAERLAGFAVHRRPPGQFLFDSRGRAQQGLRAEQLPTHVLLDASGSEVLRAAALDDGVEAAVARALTPRGPRR